MLGKGNVAPNVSHIFEKCFKLPKQAHHLTDALDLVQLI